MGALISRNLFVAFSKILYSEFPFKDYCEKNEKGPSFGIKEKREGRALPQVRCRGLLLVCGKPECPREKRT